jgi:hypothetical protein
VVAGDLGSSCEDAQVADRTGIAGMKLAHPQTL